MTSTKIADEYDAIRQRLSEIEREKTAALNAEMPKAWPDFTPVDQVYGEDNSYYPMLGVSSQWAELFATKGAKIGDVLRIRLPKDYTITDGPGLYIAPDSDAA